MQIYADIWADTYADITADISADISAAISSDTTCLHISAGMFANIYIY